MMEYSVFILLVCACLDVSDLLLDFLVLSVSYLQA